MSQSTHMRLLALPLTRRVGTLQPLVFYYAQMPSPSSPPPHSAEAEAEPSLALSTRARALFRKGLGTATKTWAGFGRAPQKSWKHRLYSAGQRVYRRIDFEELALTGVDPALGPAIAGGRGEGQGQSVSALQHAKDGERATIPLLHPSTLPSPLTQLSSLVAHRAPSHRKSMYIYLLALPITAPFALVPVIPNIPFFYCAWRAWSHYRAYRAATYLEQLLQSHTIVPTPSPLLDKLYRGFPSVPLTLSSRSSSPAPATASTTASPSASSSGTADPTPYILLTEPDVSTILSAFHLPEEGATELEIALAQARARVGLELKSLRAAEEVGAEGARRRPPGEGGEKVQEKEKVS